MAPRVESPKSGAEDEGGRRSLPRFGLALACALHAAVLGGAALIVPWQLGSWFTLVVGVLAVLHVSVAVLALSRREAALTWSFRVLSIYSLFVLALVTWVTLTSALYLIELYRGIGRAVAAALFGAWGLCALFTLPVACWGLSLTWRPLRARTRRLAAGVSVLFGAAALGTLLLVRVARAAEVEATAVAAFESELRKQAELVPAKERKQARRSLFSARPARCSQTLDVVRLTVFVTRANAEGKPEVVCLQAEHAARLVRALLAAVGDEQAVLDVVTSVRALPRLHPVLDALSLRPARDGACASGRCLTTWQLVALDAFTKHRPLPAVRDAALGVSRSWLSEVLGVASDAALLAITTASYSLADGKLNRLENFAPRPRRLDRRSLAAAVSAAERYIVAAQQKNGSFRYTLHPFTGEGNVAKVNIPRQAGTTLALCELARDKRVDRTVRRAFAQLSTYEKRSGELSLLSDSEQRAKLGSTALPLIALAACRGRLGDRHDELMARLARSLLRMQRENGSFYPEFELATGEPTGTHEPLYSAGQAVLALILMADLAAASESALLPAQGTLRSAAARAMDHYGSSYWPKGLRALFFLEENWHCLAARAALAKQRNDGYERFCIDYVAFKSRLILRESERVQAEHAGGYSLSDAFPPHNTPTAGFGEALAAAIAVKRARGLDTSEDEKLLGEVLSFLVRQQWTRDSCLFCAPGKAAVGGFSESRASPLIRIDFVQHAMAALGHGGSVLGLR